MAPAHGRPLSLRLEGRRLEADAIAERRDESFEVASRPAANGASHRAVAQLEQAWFSREPANATASGGGGGQVEGIEQAAAERVGPFVGDEEPRIDGPAATGERDGERVHATTDPVRRLAERQIGGRCRRCGSVLRRARRRRRR